jgi:acyl-CoA thioesterase FadM
MPFEATWRIYAGDTDYSGRIYTPNAIDYVIRTLSEFRRGVGFADEDFEHGPVVPPARHVDIDYLGAIRVDDELTIALTPTVGETSVTHEFTGHVDGELVIEGHLTAVFIDTETEEPVPVPPALVEELEAIGPE